jgi:site-specific DNA recombinase
MFQLAAEGKKPTEIAEIANRRGWRTRRHAARKNGKVNVGRHWTPRQVLATLSNPTYAGLIHDGKRTRPGRHDAIVDVDLFEKVRQQIESRRGRPSPRHTTPGRWPLGGLLRCGRCGRAMSPATSGYRNFIYRYYRCRSHTGGKPPCRGVSVPAFEVERFVIDLLSNPTSRSPAPGLAEAQAELLSRFGELWSRMEFDDQYRLLAEITEQVTFDVGAGTIQVTFNEAAM